MASSRRGCNGVCVLIMKPSVQACSCESLKLEGERGSNLLGSMMKDEEAMSKAASSVEVIGDSSNKVATLEEEEAAKTQQECCISKKRLIWCVRALQPKKRLGERGRDQDQAVRRGMTVQIRERKGEGGWKAKSPSDAEGLERIRPFMDKVGARLIYPALGQASLVAYMGAPSSRNNDQDFIRKADIDALIKMFKDNGNINGYSYGASMMARTVGDLDCITRTDTTPTSDHGGERSEPETTQESSGASGTHDQDVEGMTVQIRERKGEGGWKAKPPSDAEGFERIRPFMDKVGARLIYPALGQAVKPKADKSRIDLEVYLGANGRVCKDRVRQYGRVRTGEADVPGKLVQCLGKLLQKLTSSSHVVLKPRRSLDDPAGCSTSQVEDGFIPGVQKLYVVVSHPLMTPMKKEGSWKQGRKWSDQPSFKALSKLFLIHCPRRKVIAFIWYWCGECNMKKGGVFDMESSRERSLEEGEVGVDTNSSLSCHVLWSFKELTLVPWLFTRCVLGSPSIRVESRRLLPIECAMES
ncbi:hypothetical protein IGI04_036658 [Brassica rapa subsp. trilocularis]|uniref:Uncharacterized protein n=1 Tax=Brassica rapa subsp. trilocularis TaxID=1813537 RepID=A0ABQ7LF28_BRACM|nr:hypothetical protein IGI04_036658 [Brassica rapa subsp. trilocularis]